MDAVQRLENLWGAAPAGSNPAPSAPHLRICLLSPRARPPEEPRGPCQPVARPTVQHQRSAPDDDRGCAVAILLPRILVLPAAGPATQRRRYPHETIDRRRRHVARDVRRVDWYGAGDSLLCGRQARWRW